MGDQIAKLFDEVLNKYGHVGRLRLVVKTRIPLEQAQTIEDSFENIDRVLKCVDELGMFVQAKKKKRGFLIAVSG